MSIENPGENRSEQSSLDEEISEQETSFIERIERLSRNYTLLGRSSAQAVAAIQALTSASRISHKVTAEELVKALDEGKTKSQEESTITEESMKLQSIAKPKVRRVRIRNEVSKINLYEKGYEKGYEEGVEKGTKDTTVLYEKRSSGLGIDFIKHKGSVQTSIGYRFIMNTKVVPYLGSLTTTTQIDKNSKPRSLKGWTKKTVSFSLSMDSVRRETRLDRAEAMVDYFAEIALGVMVYCDVAVFIEFLTRDSNRINIQAIAKAFNVKQPNTSNIKRAIYNKLEYRMDDTQ